MKKFILVSCFVIILIPLYSFGRNEDRRGDDSCIGKIISEEKGLKSLGIISENQIENKEESLTGNGVSFVKEVGKVVVLGSEPNLFLGFEVETGSRFVIDKNGEKVLRDYQGYLIEISGYYLKDNAKLLYVQEYRVVQ